MSTFINNKEVEKIGRGEQYQDFIARALSAKEMFEGKELFKKDLIEANLLDANAQLIISQFSRELLIVMAIIPPTQKRLPVEKIVSSEATYLLYDPTTEVFTNFHELFNYVFFNQLLEIDIDPFKKSLA